LIKTQSCQYLPIKARHVQFEQNVFALLKCEQKE
jgi:hypothetical protein